MAPPFAVGVGEELRMAFLKFLGYGWTGAGTEEARNDDSYGVLGT